ncbi:ribose ABC transporter permease [Paracoccus sp. S-4012]|uniref:ABC transporter permease n=1 Tax=Paracoccus sp. S-4012 TaxID=2665648 RepID=UPI0012B15FFE|nr:ABC transporter permease [Paracoccus sp. S-4012]MRX52289.1 ribose ABC transporter permease [Paracoccus sp. S-4012]
MTETVIPRPASRTPARLGRAFLHNVPLLVLTGIVVFAALASDRFLTAYNLNNILLQASILSVLAMGMTFVIISGGFDLSVGSTVAVAGCAAAEVMLHLGIGAGLVAGLMAGLAAGLINGVLIAVVRLNPFIATMGTMVVLRGFALLYTEGQPIFGEAGLPPAFLDYARTSFLGIPLLTWTPLVLFLILGWLLHLSAFGKRLFAVGGNEEAAFLAGIDVTRTRIAAYVIAGVIAGIAGIMLASRLQSGQPTAGEGYELNAIAAVILGGASLRGGQGNLAMTIVGVLIIVILGNALNLLNVDSYWQRIAVGLVILAAAAADQLRRRKRT